MFRSLYLKTTVLVLLALFTLQITFVKAEDEEGDTYDDVKERDKASDEFEGTKKATGVSPEEAEEIAEAIERGVEYLKSKQKEDGSFGLYSNNYFVGGQALTLLALIKGGVSRKDPIIEKGMDWLREAYKREKKGIISDDGQGRTVRMGGKAPYTRTYSAGVILMLLETYYQEEAKKPRKSKKSKRKTSSRKKKKDAKAPKQLKPSSQDLQWIKELVAYIQENQHGDTGIWGYPDRAPYGGVEQPGSVSNSVGQKVWADLSNAQYALLGLKAAARMDVQVDLPELYQKVLRFLIDAQDTDGPEIEGVDVKVDEEDKHRTGVFRKTKEVYRARGWTYTGHLKNDETKIQLTRTGSMTTAALAALVIAKSELVDMRELKTGSDFDEEINQAVWDGMAWLQDNFTVKHNPATGAASAGKTTYPMWHYYYLYGLERVGMLAGRDFFGENEWYPTGARYLIKKQEENGRWNSKKDNPHAGGGHDHPTADTCYAILFLKRATIPTGVPIPRPVITGKKRKKD